MASPSVLHPSRECLEAPRSVPDLTHKNPLGRGHYLIHLNVHPQCKMFIVQYLNPFPFFLGLRVLGATQIRAIPTARLA